MRQSLPGRKLSEMLNLDAGEICVGASDMTLQFYLLPYLEAFHDAFPPMNVPAEARVRFPVYPHSL